MQIQNFQIKLPGGERKAYPSAPSDNTVDEIHGMQVADPFRPLEKLNAPQTKAWVRDENDLTRSYLDQIPERAEFEKALQSISIETRSLNQVQGDKVYFSKSVGKNHALICETTLGSQDEKVLLDPNELSSDGSISTDQWKVSPDGQTLVYGVRRNGTDEMEWRLRDLKTGEDYSEKLANGRYGADDISWSADSKGFFYSKYQPAQEGQAITEVVKYDNQYYHELATPQSADQTGDTPGLPAQDWSYREVDGNNWSRIGDDQNGRNLVVAKGPMYPKGAILAWDEENEEQKILVAGNDHNLVEATFAQNQVFAHYLKDGHSHLVRYDAAGKKLGEIDLPGMGTLSGVHEAPDGKVLYQFSSPSQPPTVYKFDVSTGQSEELWKPVSGFPSDRYVTDLMMLPSKDGTEVPVYVTRRKDVELDGERPTYLYAYGGFNVNETPSFDWTKLPWLDKGGVYATACLRGGGENGEQWHKDGMRLRKQNVFDDFIAAGEGLIAKGVTSPGNLGIGGGSNGGLLVSATELQRPDLFGAAIPEVGVTDMARFANFTGGFHWVPEYGEVEKPNLFKKMMSYSPVHNVIDGNEYPPTMVMTGDHDDRVTPSHSYKFAAELQQSQGGDNPILLRTQANIGHGFGTPRWMRIEENADKMAFLWHHLSEEKAS